MGKVCRLDESGLRLHCFTVRCSDMQPVSSGGVLITKHIHTLVGVSANKIFDNFSSQRQTPEYVFVSSVIL